MTECYAHIDSDYRCYHGWQFNDTEMKSLVSDKVRANMLDTTEQNNFLDDLAGLPLTGFDSARILADIKAIGEEDPEDTRSWRIGEAIAEVALEEHLNCRFHWNELRDSRNPIGNKTGADMVGFIEVNGDVLFLFGETKTSSEIANRPPQVMTGAKQMEVQLKDLYATESKRMRLIRYIASKIRNLPETDQLVLDYRNALKTYYIPDHPNYQLTGVLIRDVDQDEEDLKSSYTKLKNIVLDPVGIRLIACYLPVKKESLEALLNRKTEG